jgi:hypothetical protein
MANDKEKDDKASVVAPAEAKVIEPVTPPLEAAAHRLERSLGTGSAKDYFTYSNPAKIVRRWLGTSSGATQSATLSDVASAAERLLDPNLNISTAREQLMSFANDDSKMEADEKKEVLAEPAYATVSSAREIDSWLVSLAVRLLWKKQDYAQALTLAQEGIVRTEQYLQTVSQSVSTSASSLFPLLARLYRLRSLVVESKSDSGPLLHADMARAYNLAVLRRDTDSQATLLNGMLRDLLLHREGMFWTVFQVLIISSFTNRLFFCHSLQLSKPTNSCPIPHFLKRLPPTTSYVAICFTVDVFKPCDLSIPRLSQV